MIPRSAETLSGPAPKNSSEGMFCTLVRYVCTAVLGKLRFCIENTCHTVACSHWSALVCVLVCESVYTCACEWTFMMPRKYDESKLSDFLVKKSTNFWTLCIAF